MYPEMGCLGRHRGRGEANLFRRPCGEDGADQSIWTLGVCGLDPVGRM